MLQFGCQKLLLVVIQPKLNSKAFILALMLDKSGWGPRVLEHPFWSELIPDSLEVQIGIPPQFMGGVGGKEGGS